jgi:multisubunit Na+/H+ antiporter MnhE subunit
LWLPEFELGFKRFLCKVIGQHSLQQVLLSAVLSVRLSSPCRQLLNVKLIFFRLSIGFILCYIFLTEKTATDFKIFSLPVSIENNYRSEYFLKGL